MKIAIYPGSFDPITLGHLNIIKRAAACFDKLIVCVMVNGAKAGTGLFTPDERVELIRRTVERLPNVEVDCSSVLVAEYAREKKACTLVKGLRAVSDYEYELQMALINRKLPPPGEERRHSSGWPPASAPGICPRPVGPLPHSPAWPCSKARSPPASAWPSPPPAG